VTIRCDDERTNQQQRQPRTARRRDQQAADWHSQQQQPQQREQQQAQSLKGTPRQSTLGACERITLLLAARSSCRILPRWFRRWQRGVE
jgi:hypothetical protein